MEDTEWKKDETSYLIFMCNKCKRYLYVKTSQKSKKCLQCGHMHKVSTTILKSGEIIKGLINAIKMVKNRQHDLALKEIGNEPEFRGSQDFKIVRKQKIKKLQLNSRGYDNDFTAKFKKMLIEISETYKEFPSYIMEVMADNYGIPNSEIKMLTRYFLKEGFLIRLENYLYTINSKSH